MRQTGKPCTTVDHRKSIKYSNCMLSLGHITKDYLCSKYTDTQIKSFD